MTRKFTTGYPARKPRAAASLIPFSTAGMKLLGMAPPKMSLTNSNSTSELGQRLHFDFAVAVLAVAAGLLLVASLDVGFAANGFAIRNLGRFEHDFGVVTLLHLGDDDFNVLLSGAGDQEFFGLRIAEEAQHGVFFHELVETDAELVFIGAALGLDGEGDGGLGHCTAG